MSQSDMADCARTNQTRGSNLTPCCFENRTAVVARALVEQFIATFSSPPESLILDFDTTDDPADPDLLVLAGVAGLMSMVQT
ncbi:hypothetical protein [Chitinivorax sp. B]|uniref:hypothetical protein n=1 Tax=Chitinivorax sp. B TaxID=2502235 RepID=UPI0010F9736C|nr:hypothetical protein [Chitinivorax sp. B]